MTVNGFDVFGAVKEKKEMKEMIKITASLVIILVAAEFLMAAVFAKTAPIVED